MAQAADLSPLMEAAIEQAEREEAAAAKVRALEDEIDRYQRELHNAARKSYREAQEGLSEQELERAKKEADAWAHELGDKVIAAMTPLVLFAAIDALHESAEAVRKLVEQGGLTAERLREIDEAHAAFIEELNIARMSVLD